MRKLVLALFALAFAFPASAQNYTATPGSGLTFGAKSISSILYPQQLMCDPATPANCVSVNASGQITLANSGFNALQGGNANSLTNPFFMSPATGSVWSISAASGAIVAGAGADGAFVTDGTKADAPATLPTSTTAASGISIWKAIANALNSLLSAATTPLDNTSVPINISTATTTQLVALSGSTQVRITSWDVIAGGTGTFQLVYGTGTACATGQNPLTGAYPLTAQAGEAKGSGIGTILKTPAGQAVCAVTVGAVQYSGSLSFQQF